MKNPRTQGLRKRTKNHDKPLIAQILGMIPPHIFRSAVRKRSSDKGCHRYRTYDQFVAMTFGQLNKCHTLEDISAGLAVSGGFLEDLGLRQSPARSTMSDGNRKRNWLVFKDVYDGLLRHYKGALRGNASASVPKEVEGVAIKVNDSTTMPLCLALFDWAKFRTAKGGVKVHTSLDLWQGIPDVVNITEASVHDRKGLDHLSYPCGTVVIEDKGYFDFGLMRARTVSGVHFVTRIKTNTIYTVMEERDLPPDRDGHILMEEIIRLSSKKAEEAGMDNIDLRRIVVYKEEDNSTIELITNNLDWEAATVAQLYKLRWEVELFFKAIKQNLQVKTFIGTSENAVKSQIYIALICFLLLKVLAATSKQKRLSFSHFVERVRICLTYYISLNHVCNNICQGAHRLPIKSPPDLFQAPSNKKQPMAAQIKLF